MNIPPYCQWWSAVCPVQNPQNDGVFSNTPLTGHPAVPSQPFKLFCAPYRLAVSSAEALALQRWVYLEEERQEDLNLSNMLLISPEGMLTSTAVGCIEEQEKEAVERRRKRRKFLEESGQREEAAKVVDPPSGLPRNRLVFGGSGVGKTRLLLHLLSLVNTPGAACSHKGWELLQRFHSKNEGAQSLLSASLPIAVYTAASDLFLALGGLDAFQAASPEPTPMTSAVLASAVLATLHRQAGRMSPPAALDKGVLEAALIQALVSHPVILLLDDVDQLPLPCIKPFIEHVNALQTLNRTTASFVAPPDLNSVLIRQVVFSFGCIPELRSVVPFCHTLHFVLLEELTSQSWSLLVETLFERDAACLPHLQTPFVQAPGLHEAISASVPAAPHALTMRFDGAALTSSVGGEASGRTPLTPAAINNLRHTVAHLTPYQGNPSLVVLARRFLVDSLPHSTGRAACPAFWTAQWWYEWLLHSVLLETPALAALPPQPLKDLTSAAAFFLVWLMDVSALLRPRPVSLATAPVLQAHLPALFRALDMQPLEGLSMEESSEKAMLLLKEFCVEALDGRLLPFHQSFAKFLSARLLKHDAALAKLKGLSLETLLAPDMQALLSDDSEALPPTFAKFSVDNERVLTSLAWDEVFFFLGLMRGPLWLYSQIAGTATLSEADTHMAKWLNAMTEKAMDKGDLGQVRFRHLLRAASCLCLPQPLWFTQPASAPSPCPDASEATAHIIEQHSLCKEQASATHVMECKAAEMLSKALVNLICRSSSSLRHLTTYPVNIMPAYDLGTVSGLLARCLSTLRTLSHHFGTRLVLGVEMSGCLTLVSNFKAEISNLIALRETSLKRKSVRLLHLLNSISHASTVIHFQNLLASLIDEDSYVRMEAMEAVISRVTIAVQAQVSRAEIAGSLHPLPLTQIFAPNTPSNVRTLALSAVSALTRLMEMSIEMKLPVVTRSDDVKKHISALYTPSASSEDCSSFKTGLCKKTILFQCMLQCPHIEVVNLAAVFLATLSLKQRITGGAKKMQTSKLVEVVCLLLEALGSRGFVALSSPIPLPPTPDQVVSLLCNVLVTFFSEHVAPYVVMMGGLLAKHTGLMLYVGSLLLRMVPNTERCAVVTDLLQACIASGRGIEAIEVLRTFMNCFSDSDASGSMVQLLPTLHAVAQKASSETLCVECVRLFGEILKEDLMRLSEHILFFLDVLHGMHGKAPEVAFAVSSALNDIYHLCMAEKVALPLTVVEDVKRLLHEGSDKVCEVGLRLLCLFGHAQALDGVPVKDLLTEHGATVGSALLNLCKSCPPPAQPTPAFQMLLEELADLLAHAQSQTRATASSILSSYGHLGSGCVADAVVDTMLKRLLSLEPLHTCKEATSRMRECCIRVLGAVGVARPDAAAELGKALWSTDVRERMAAVLALGEMGDAALPFIGPLVDHLSSDDGEMVSTAAASLCKLVHIPSADVERHMLKMVRMIAKEDVHIQEAGLTVLRECPANLIYQSLPLLTPLLNDEEDAIRVACLRCVSRMSTAHMRENIGSVMGLLNEDDTRLKKEILKLLRMHSAIAREHQSKVDNLLSRFFEKGKVKIQAMLLLGELGLLSSASIPSIVHMLKTREPGVLATFSSAVKVLGKHILKVIAMLISSLKENQFSTAKRNLMKIIVKMEYEPDMEDLMAGIFGELLTLLLEDDEIIRRGVLNCLVHLKTYPASVLEMIVRQVRDARPLVRQCSVITMAEVGRLHPATVPTMHNFLMVNLKSEVEAPTKILASFTSSSSSRPILHSLATWQHLSLSWGRLVKL